MLHPPFYDPTKSYEHNYDSGPFGAFADGQVFEQKNEPAYDFHGLPVYSPFGIPPGPLINSNFVKGAFDKGFDVSVYKTVRSASFPCHPWPNVLAVKLDGNLTLDRAAEPLVATANYTEPLSITNSFGVPSKEPSIWQADVEKALSHQKKGQVLVLSFMGTVCYGQSQEKFIEDYAVAAKLAAETNAPVLETNISCPNIGNEGLVCYNLEVTAKVLAAIRRVIGNRPLIVKIGYFREDAMLAKLAEIVNEYANDIAAINTIQATVISADGGPALPGPNRLRSGICGASIKWAGLDMMRRLKRIREEKGYRFALTGVGGVMTPADWQDYRAAGADTIMSATGAMWNPYLAQKIKPLLSNKSQAGEFLRRAIV